MSNTDRVPLEWPDEEYIRLMKARYGVVYR